MSVLDYTIILLYFLLVAWLGVMMGRCNHNAKDYFTGNNSFRWFWGGITNYMTMISTFTFIAYAGIAYNEGAVALTILWSSSFATIFGSLFLARRWQRSKISTPTEFLENRYNGTVRQTISWGGIGFRMLDNMVRLYAMGLFISAATGFPLLQAILLTGGAVLLYTMVGGIFAIVLTNVVQCLMLFLTTLILIPVVWLQAGGWEGLSTSIPQHFSLCNGPKGTIWYIAVYYLMILVKYNGNWTFIQRFYSMRSEKEALKMGIFSALLFFILPPLLLFPSFAGPIIVPGLVDPETAHVAVCRAVLPAGLLGLVVASMFAATMSTLSAEYNVIASVLTKDIYQRLFKKQASDRDLFLTGRLATLLVGGSVMLGTLLIEGVGGAFEANKTLTALLGVPLTVPLLFGILFKRPTPAGAVFSIIIGILSGAIFLNGNWFSWEVGALIQFILTFIAIFVPTWFLRPSHTYRSRVAEFFRQLETPSLEIDSSLPSSSLTEQEQRNITAFMTCMFSIAIFVCAILFFIPGVANAGLLSGQLTIVAGVICTIIAVIQFRKSRGLLRQGKKQS